MFTRGVCAGALVVVMGSGVALAVPSYEEGLLEFFAGYHPTAQGTATGIALGDYDNDGDIDAYVPCGLPYPNRMYQNQGDGTFVDVAFDLGVAGSGENQRAALWVDVDADGDLDLIVMGDNFKKNFGPYNSTTCWLYLQQPDHTFVNATAGSGLDFLVIRPEDDPPNSAEIGGVAAGDLTGDGLPDLVVSFWWGPIQVYQNHGDGTFTDITEQAGTGAHTAHWQPILHDFDRDGDLDIFCAVDYYDNKFFLNDGTGVFTEAAEAYGLDNHFNDMGVAPGDYDNDGDIDLFVTNIHEENTIYAGTNNILMRNDINTTGGFTEVAMASGVAYGGWGWGCTFTDGDLDGDLDLAQTNGFYTRAFPFDPSRYYVNNGSGMFTNMANDVGVTDNDWGSGFVAADLDRDGDPDLVQICNEGPIRKYTNLANPAPGGSWLVVKPRMVGPNTHALGAMVRATVNGQTQTRLITAGTSMMSQEPAEAYFGFGGATTIDSLVIEWPDGRKTCQTNVPAGQTMTITAPPSGGTSGFVNAYASGSPSADRNGDGAIDAADVRAFVRERVAHCP